MYTYLSCSSNHFSKNPGEAKGALLSEAPHASPISTIASSDDRHDTSMESSVKPPLILPMLLASSVAVNVMLFLVILRSCKKRDDAGANGNKELDWKVFLRYVFFGNKKMVCGKCCWSQLLKALNVGETADLHFSVKIHVLFVMDNLILFSLFLSVFQASSKNYEAFRIRRHLDVACKNSVSSAIEASTSPFWLFSFQTSLWRRLSCNGMTQKKSQLAGRRYGTKALTGVQIFAAVILPKGWQQYLLDRQWGDTNCAWSKKMMPASWWVSWNDVVGI